MSITNVKNAGLYYLKPTISNRLGESLESQTTGKIHLGKRQVNQAISMQSEFTMEKVKGALQNIGIARSFLLTAQANLGTVVESLNTLAGDVMTLLNQVVPSANNQAAVNKIIATLGMMKGPISRDQEEGIIVKSLRQGGVGGALYFRVQTKSFLSLDPTLNEPATFAQDAALTETGNDTIDPVTASVVLGATFSADVFAEPVVTVIGTYAHDSASPPVGAPLYQIMVSFGNKSYTIDTKTTPLATPAAGDIKLVNLAIPFGATAPDADDSLTLKYKTVTDLTGATGPTDQATTDAAAAKIRADIHETLVAGTWTPLHLKTDDTTFKAVKGFVDFKLNASSNYGEGLFTLQYDGQNMTFRDPYDTLIESYPVDFQVIKEAGLRAKQTGTPVEVQIGNIGSLYINEHADGSAPAKGFKFGTESVDFKAALIVSANDGTRTIIMPDITNPVKLWGEKIVIDANRLQTDMEYQQQVKGMIDHASQLVRDTYQNVTNLVGVLESDETAQNASLQSLHDLNSTVSDANAVEVATDVFDFTQQYRQLLNAVKLISSVQASEKAAANQIANLASAD